MINRAFARYRLVRGAAGLAVAGLILLAACQRTQPEPAGGAASPAPEEPATPIELPTGATLSSDGFLNLHAAPPGPARHEGDPPDDYLRPDGDDELAMRWGVSREEAQRLRLSMTNLHAESINCCVMKMMRGEKDRYLGWTFDPAAKPTTITVWFDTANPEATLARYLSHPRIKAGRANPPSETQIAAWRDFRAAMESKGIELHPTPDFKLINVSGERAAVYVPVTASSFDRVIRDSGLTPPDFVEFRFAAEPLAPQPDVPPELLPHIRHLAVARATGEGKLSGRYIEPTPGRLRFDQGCLIFESDTGARTLAVLSSLWQLGFDGEGFLALKARNAPPPQGTVIRIGEAGWFYTHAPDLTPAERQSLSTACGDLPVVSVGGVVREKIIRGRRVRVTLDETSGEP